MVGSSKPYVINNFKWHKNTCFTQQTEWLLETDTILPLREQRQPLRNQEEPGIIDNNQCNEKLVAFKVRDSS